MKNLMMMMMLSVLATTLTIFMALMSEVILRMTFGLIIGVELVTLQKRTRKNLWNQHNYKETGR